MKYLEGESTEATKQGGLKAEAAEAVTSDLRWGASDERQQASEDVLWTGLISDDVIDLRLLAWAWGVALSLGLL